MSQGVPTNFDVQEILLDHAFELLGIDDDRVNHPVSHLLLCHRGTSTP